MTRSRGASCCLCALPRDRTVSAVLVSRDDGSRVGGRERSPKLFLHAPRRHRIQSRDADVLGYVERHVSAWGESLAAYNGAGAGCG